MQSNKETSSADANKLKNQPAHPKQEDSPKAEKAKKQSPEANKPAKPAKPRKRKKTRVWTKVAVVVFCFIAMYAGMIIGYVKVGKQPMSDVWELQTWKHVFDLIFAP